MITVLDLMKTHLVSTLPSSSVRDALARLADAGVRHLPVVDERSHLIGIVSQRDLARAHDLQRATTPHDVTLVRDVMRREVLRATPTLPASEAAAMMIEHKIGSLPVVDAEGRVIGIVTETDFLEVAREALLGVSPEARARA